MILSYDIEKNAVSCATNIECKTVEIKYRNENDMGYMSEVCGTARGST